MESWIATSWSAIGGVVFTATAIYIALILFTRLAGLRSFSKMSGFDFAMTVALGSIIASSILTASPPLPQAIAGLAIVYVLQISVAHLRQRSRKISRWVDNEPIVLMTSEGMVLENLRHARVTEHDVWSKLREANVLTIAEVRAVVFETTGDISVLHGEPEGPALEAALLTGVRDAELVDTVDHGNAKRYV